MTKPLVEYPDAEAKVIAYLDSAYAGPLASRKPDTISTQPPQTTLTAGTEWLQVELDGTLTDIPWNEGATVRWNYYTAPGKRSDAKAGASLASGLLDIHPGDTHVRGTTRLIGRSQPIADPETKNLMCWGTHRVNLRPAVLTV